MTNRHLNILRKLAPDCHAQTLHCKALYEQYLLLDHILPADVCPRDYLLPRLLQSIVEFARRKDEITENAVRGWLAAQVDITSNYIRMRRLLKPGEYAAAVILLKTKAGLSCTDTGIDKYLDKLASTGGIVKQAYVRAQPEPGLDVFYHRAEDAVLFERLERLFSTSSTGAWYSTVQGYFAGLYSKPAELEYRLIESAPGCPEAMQLLGRVVTALQASLVDTPVEPMMLARGNVMIGA